jgi:hypothetical protein
MNVSLMLPLTVLNYNITILRLPAPKIFLIDFFFFCMNFFIFHYRRSQNLDFIERVMELLINNELGCSRDPSRPIFRCFPSVRLGEGGRGIP